MLGAQPKICKPNDFNELGNYVIMWMMEEFRRKHDSFETWFNYLKRTVWKRGKKQWNYTDQSLIDEKHSFHVHGQDNNRATTKIKT